MMVHYTEEEMRLYNILHGENSDKLTEEEKEEIIKKLIEINEERKEEIRKYLPLC